MLFTPLLPTPLNKKHKKTTKKLSGSSPRVELKKRTARAAERYFEVVFKLFIFRLDLLFLLHQGKRKEYLFMQQQFLKKLLSPPLNKKHKKTTKK
ncbi:hypothetical protein [Flavobacterium psychrolimnae]|uniref:Uncharacterized protein n=1 Tax=Flavobacterium psychrolimnae TaxID=249351 RepID=A0A366AZZ5_9FLAO|nr:hypothetical protein [Flavobacterium psychrolimnae]RBN49487.1 hypothetical protein DR980_12395 [Flavobacterium psychrolimnae]